MDVRHREQLHHHRQTVAGQCGDGCTVAVAPQERHHTIVQHAVNVATGKHDVAEPPDVRHADVGDDHAVVVHDRAAVVPVGHELLEALPQTRVSGHGEGRAMYRNECADCGAGDRPKGRTVSVQDLQDVRLGDDAVDAQRVVVLDDHSDAVGAVINHEMCCLYHQTYQKY